MDEIQKKAEEFVSRLKAHGFENSGYNLLGFTDDLDAYLNEAFNSAATIDVKTPGPYGLTFEVTCLPKTEFVDIEYLKRSVEQMWASQLRYREFENHLLVAREKGFDLLFITLAKKLGVTGVIKVRGK